MSYLLDTMTWFWLCEKPHLIPPDIDKELVISGVPFLSVASVWEIARKAKLSERKPRHPSAMRLRVPIRTWMEKALDEEALTLLPLTSEIAIESNYLPGDFHDDPMDQIIVATARLYNLTVVSSDTQIRKYNQVRCLYFKGPAPQSEHD